MKIGWRIWLLIIILLLALLAIRPSFETGVLIKSVEKNSTAFNEGLRTGEIIKSVNNEEIKNLEDYSNAITEIFPVENKTKLIINTKTSSYVLFTNEPLKITVDEIPKTRIKAGLDLQGGARALVKPEISLSSSEIQDLISVTANRLNVYGISDVTLRSVSDLQGNNFMLVEVAGATPADLKELISKQGKFEAKIGNNTVFIGGEKDITRVCRKDASCARIETCFENQGREVCRFYFTISLSEEAAEKHANITSELGINTTEFGRYLDQKLDLYLDDKLVDSLLISEDLKGQVTTQIQISGSGTGVNREDAINNAKASMYKLQTVLITGSLPYKLEIVKLDTISPQLGETFIYTILIAGLAAIFAVGVVIFIRYRRFKASLLLLFTSISEVVIILGVASLINWNLDLASIAGILAVIGTGIDQQIVILDEARTGKHLSLTERLKRALFIIVSAYVTSLVALLPLYWAGAGLLKGFAVTTIIGITAGVLITRPAFAEIVKRIEE